ncbi:MAG TPA: hypothetical protein VGS00_07145, partial [Thermoanaerobaculia bacterium]|nr:hypothetical protein [Thermoanaerobaculia bacterium]
MRAGAGAGADAGRASIRDGAERSMRGDAGAGAAAGRGSMRGAWRGESASRDRCSRGGAASPRVSGRRPGTTPSMTRRAGGTPLERDRQSPEGGRTAAGAGSEAAGARPRPRQSSDGASVSWRRSLRGCAGSIDRPRAGASRTVGSDPARP